MKAALLAAAIGCSGPATLPELARAEQLARQGDVEGAIGAYQVAQVRCGDLKPARRAKRACDDALLGEAEVLERNGQRGPAIAAYLAIPTRTDDPTTGATATYRAGRLLLEAGKTRDAWTALWRVVTEWPDEALAADALIALVGDGRVRDAKALADELLALLAPLAGTQVADNLLWSLAELGERELENPEAARAFYDRIPVDTPGRGLRDDARWHGARLSRALGDHEGAVTRLRALLATREVAIGPGSYFSIWLDDAQLELGRVLRDELRDASSAIAAFRALPEHYPASILLDDALHELAVTYAGAGSTRDACAAIARLRKQAPDSKYLDEAGVLAATLSCP